MLKILLCDDDRFFLSLESAIIQNIINEEKPEAMLCGMAQTAAEALALVDGGDLLVFLDLDFGRNMPSGIDISSVLKQKGRNVRIVFTTNHSEMAMQVLKSGAEPFGFLEKGGDIAALSDGIRRYVRMATGLGKKTENCRTVTLDVGGEEVKLRVPDIIYLETEKNLSHGITYHTAAGSKITVISTLEAEGERLGEEFLRVHRSYLVNMAHIVSYRDGSIILSDRSSVYLPFKKRAEVKKWLSEKQ